LLVQGKWSKVEDKYHLTDDKLDILSHPKRRAQIHVLTLDAILADDICERLAADQRLKRYAVLCPRVPDFRTALELLERTARDTVSSRLLIFDVRRVTLPKLRRVFNAVVGYNRRDFNKLCFSICIGDGPVNLFQDGRAVDLFIPYLASHRVDFHPAVFFYDPFLHYVPSELLPQGIDDEFVIPDAIPRRLAPYFKSETMRVGQIRQFFRAVDKDEETRTRRRRMLRHIYKKRLAEQFPGQEDQYRALLSRHGIQLATEKLNLYPFHFEDWVHDLMRRARHNATAPKPDTP
jgi:hypothetical protein